MYNMLGEDSDTTIVVFLSFPSVPETVTPVVYSVPAFQIPS